MMLTSQHGVRSKHTLSPIQSNPYCCSLRLPIPVPYSNRHFMKSAIRGDWRIQMALCRQWKLSWRPPSSPRKLSRSWRTRGCAPLILRTAKMAANGHKWEVVKSFSVKVPVDRDNWIIYAHLSRLALAWKHENKIMYSSFRYSIFDITGGCVV